MSDMVKEHRKLIDALGGSTAVAEAVTEISGEQVTREAVVRWKKRGVAWRWRGAVAELAAKKRKAKLIPEGFLVQRSAA